jgi:hypothetical protein
MNSKWGVQSRTRDVWQQHAAPVLLCTQQKGGEQKSPSDALFSALKCTIMNDAKLRTNEAGEGKKSLLTPETDLMKQNVTLDYACTEPNSSETRVGRRNSTKQKDTQRVLFFLVCARRRKAAALNRQHDSHWHNTRAINETNNSAKSSELRKVDQNERAENNQKLKKRGKRRELPRFIDPRGLQIVFALSPDKVSAARRLHCAIPEQDYADDLFEVQRRRRGRRKDDLARLNVTPDQPEPEEFELNFN